MANKLTTWLNEDREKRNPKLTVFMTLLMILLGGIGAIVLVALIIQLVLSS